MKRHFLLIINPVAGNKDKKHLHQKVQQYLDTHEFSHQSIFTQRKGHAMELFHEGIAPSITDLIIIGGDGTLNEIVNSLKKNRIDLPIGIIPTGTGNDYIKSIPFPKKLSKQLEVAVFGKLLSVDLGQCNDRYFLNTMGFGFDGKVAAIMEEDGKRFSGHLSYLYTVLRTVTKFKEPEVNFIVDGTPRKEHVFLMAINNGTTYGGGFKITPKAKVDDGLFDVCFIKKISIWRRYLNLPKLQLGTHAHVREIEMLTCKSIQVDYAHNVLAHLDGEFIGPPPYQVNLIHKSQFIRTASINS